MNLLRILPFSSGLCARPLAASLLLGSLLLPSGCLRGSPSEKPPIHLNPNMDRQPKYLPQSASSFFRDGAAMQSPVPGTVARGELQEDQAFFTGRSPWGFYLPQPPLPPDSRLLNRGRERYTIYCRPCHGQNGDGRGPLFVRAHVRSADLRQPRLRQMPAGRLFHIISQGSGLMPSYAHLLSPADRWAVVAYVREAFQRQGEGEQREEEER